VLPEKSTLEEEAGNMKHTKPPTNNGPCSHTSAQKPDLSPKSSAIFQSMWLTPPETQSNNTCLPPPPHSHNKYDRSGVYQLTCPDCSMKYIGQTGRPFSVRYKEHNIEYTHDNPKSKFSEKLLQAHHSIGPVHTIMEPLTTPQKAAV
jgi:hypothetical protein